MRNNIKRKIKRDYDKEPLVLNDYSYFNGINTIICLIVLGNSIFFIDSLKRYFKEENFTFEISTFFTVITIYIACPLMSFMVFYFFNIKNESKIKFFNKKIQFYMNRKIVRKFIPDNRSYVARFSIAHAIEPKMLLIYSSPLLLIAYAKGESPAVFFPLLVAFLIPVLYAYYIRRFIYHKLNGNLYGFTPYLEIAIDRAYMLPRHKYGITILYFTYKDYLGLKEYFNNTLYIDIDKVERREI